jgi:hypothetical protein
VHEVHVEKSFLYLYIGYRRELFWGRFVEETPTIPTQFENGQFFSINNRQKLMFVQVIHARANTHNTVALAGFQKISFFGVFFVVGCIEREGERERD